MLPLTDQHCSLLLHTARLTLVSALAGREHAHADGSIDDPVLLQPAGCFVSLHVQHTGRLRGCVGRIDATHPLLEAVRRCATGVLDDPRFAHVPITLDELTELELEISVLSPLRAADHPLAFDPLADGIYLTVGERTGCFLPQVARQTGWTREQLLARLCTEKMNLPPDMWQHPAAELFVFTTLIVGPERCALPNAER